MVRLTEKERIEILMMLVWGDRRRSSEEVCTVFNENYPNGTSLTRSAVCRLCKIFQNRENVKDGERTGRRKTATGEEKTLDVLLSIEENPHLSTRQIALTHSMDEKSVRTVLKRERVHPYKVHLQQKLNEDDFDRRLQFCKEMIERCNTVDRFANKIIFSDKATFCLNGHVNRHNSRYWSRVNPHWMEQTHTQRLR